MRLSPDAKTPPSNRRGNRKTFSVPTEQPAEKKEKADG